jgi:hypothetical protein
MTFFNSRMFDSRDDVVEWLENMIPCDFDYLEQAGASYIKEIRTFEGIMRPLWGLVPKYYGKSKLADLIEEPVFQKFQELIGNQKLPAFSTENRQIAVEVGVLGYILGTFGHDFMELLPAKDQYYLLEWLNGINEIEFPAGNWYFFLVLVNTALKSIGANYSETRLQEALEGIEGFYLEDGWYTDGANQQRDYYVSFAFHFYGLLYSRFGDPAIGARYQERALLFAEDFSYWFDYAGRSLPYGRSLTYRFAHVSFWAAMIVTGVYKKSIFSLGEIKQLFLDNLRFWSAQPIIAPKEKNLSVGYGYSNLLLSEDYNAPSSPMWAFKSFLILELTKEDRFWQTKESNKQKKPLRRLPHAGFIIQTELDQTIALSCSQYAANPGLYHGREKYSKFAYSTYFGFNINRDNQRLEEFAIDSTLAFSLAGTQQFQTRGTIKQGIVYDDYSVSFWEVYQNIHVTTYLIPVENGGHIRIHDVDTPFSIESAEGGFPLPDWNKKYDEPKQTNSSCLLDNNYGYSMIVDLLGNRTPKVIPQGPNTNLYSPEKNAIPTLVNPLRPGRHLLASYVEASSKKKIDSFDSDIRLIEREEYFEVFTNKTIKIKKEQFS